MVFNEVPILKLLYFRDMHIDFAFQILSHYLEKSWMWLLVVTQYYMYNVALRLHNYTIHWENSDNSLQIHVYVHEVT